MDDTDQLVTITLTPNEITALRSACVAHQARRDTVPGLDAATDPGEQQAIRTAAARLTEAHKRTQEA